jgi:hypothetical protein
MAMAGVGEVSGSLIELQAWRIGEPRMNAQAAAAGSWRGYWQAGGEVAPPLLSVRLDVFANRLLELGRAGVHAVDLHDYMNATASPAAAG